MRLSIMLVQNVTLPWTLLGQMVSGACGFWKFTSCKIPMLASEGVSVLLSTVGFTLTSEACVK